MRFFLLIIMTFIFVSCGMLEDGGEKNKKTNDEIEDCYRMDPEITLETCANAGCSFVYASIGFLSNLNGQSCLQGQNASAWFEYTQKPAMPMCYPSPFNNTDGNLRYQGPYCKSFTQHAVYVLVLPDYFFRPPSQDGWFLCADQFSFCESTCGNGRVEPWEQCDGQDPADLCRDFMDYYGWGDWHSNHQLNFITCDRNCRFDFSDCYLDPPVYKNVQR